MKSAIKNLHENYRLYSDNLEKVAQEFAQYENEEYINNFVIIIAERKVLQWKRVLKTMLNPRAYFKWKRFFFVFFSYYLDFHLCSSFLC